jgi:hypothetical protein
MSFVDLKVSWGKMVFNGIMPIAHTIVGAVWGRQNS